MKKLLILLLMIPFISFSQDIRPMGNGIYQLEIYGGAPGWPASRKLKEKAKKQVADFASKNNAKYEMISLEGDGMSLWDKPGVRIIFRLVNETNSISNSNTSAITTSEKKKKITKDAARKELKELKELLDLGLLSQEEFDKKAVILKKIILEDNYPH